MGPKEGPDTTTDWPTDRRSKITVGLTETARCTHIFCLIVLLAIIIKYIL
jgi:hypothetical protein